ncbi:MAG: alpha-hydroxy-acid oxidizing protein, partial [Candidatus Hodarchaeota archaeon]
AKETGAGFAAEEAKLLAEVGVKGIDIAGAGGTSWAAVEFYRARTNRARERLGRVFWDWGIPTAISTVEVSQTTQLKVITSGGIRTGINAAKCICLGANVVGIASPFLKTAERDLKTGGEPKDSIKLIKTLIDELKITMLLTGSEKISDLNVDKIEPF